MNCIVIGASIGDNVIVGAGSVVTKNLESGFVYGGVPAKKLMSIEDFFEKRKKLQVDEAVQLVISYIEKYGSIPDKYYLREYFWIFTQKEDVEKGEFKEMVSLCGNKSSTIDTYSSPLFENYDRFIEHCLDVKKATAGDKHD